MKPIWSFIILFLSLILPSSAKSEAKSAMPMYSVFKNNSDFDFIPPTPGTYELPVIKIAPGGKVIDHDGQILELEEILNGKISIVSFVYLTCTDTEGCPLVLSNFFQLYHQSEYLPELKNKVQLVTISFDPLRDTVEAINAFQYPISIDSNRSKKIKWTILTTKNNKWLKVILDGYSQVITRSQDSNIINHIIRIYLVDEKKKIRNIYGLGTLDPRLLITDIETLLLDKAR